MRLESGSVTVSFIQIVHSGIFCNLRTLEVIGLYGWGLLYPMVNFTKNPKAWTFRKDLGGHPAWSSVQSWTPPPESLNHY